MKKTTIILFLSLGILSNLNADNNNSINENQFYNELVKEEINHENENRVFIELVNNFKSILTENIKLTNKNLKSDLEIEKLKFDIKKLKEELNEKDIEIKILKTDLKNAEINMNLKENLIIKNLSEEKELEKQKELENKELTILQLQSKLKTFKEKYKNKTGKVFNKDFKICEIKKKAVNLRKLDDINSLILRKHYKGDLLKIDKIGKDWIKTDRGYVFKSLCDII